MFLCVSRWCQVFLSVWGGIEDVSTCLKHSRGGVGSSPLRLTFPRAAPTLFGGVVGRGLRKMASELSFLLISQACVGLSGCFFRGFGTVWVCFLSFVNVSHCFSRFSQFSGFGSFLSFSKIVPRALVFPWKIFVFLIVLVYGLMFPVFAGCCRFFGFLVCLTNLLLVCGRKGRREGRR